MQVLAENKVVPKLRFKEFEDEWEEKKLGETSEMIGGGTPDTNNQNYWGGPIQWFTPSELNEKYISKSNRTISDLGLKQSSAKMLPKGAILFSSRATIGEVSIALNQCCTNQGFQSFVVHPSNSSEFLYYWIFQNKSAFIKRASGSTFLEISKKEIAKIKINRPDYPEQKKIADFLSSVDNKLQCLKKKKELLEQYKKGLMQKIFSQEIRFKDDNGNDYPDWEEKKLGEIANFYKGKGLPKSEINTDGEYKCIHYGELFLKYSEVIDRVVSRTSINSNRFLSKANDILMPTSDVTPNGLATASCLNEDNVILGGDILIIRQEHKIMNGDYFAYRISSNRKEVMRLVSGSTVYHLYGSDMKLLSVQLPCVEEQKKIADFLSSVDNKVELVDTQITQTESFKKGLLQQMFV